MKNWSINTLFSKSLETEKAKSSHFDRTRGYKNQKFPTSGASWYNQKLKYFPVQILCSDNKTNQPITFNFPIILRYLVLSHPLQSDFVSIWKVCGLHHHLSIIIRRVLSHGFQKRISKIWILWQECLLCTIQNSQLWNFTLVQQDLGICCLRIHVFEMCEPCRYVFKESR